MRVGLLAPLMIMPSRRHTSELVSLPVCFQVPPVQRSGEPTRAAPMIFGACTSVRRTPAVEDELVADATEPVVARSVTRHESFLPTSADPTL